LLVLMCYGGARRCKATVGNLLFVGRFEVEDWWPWKSPNFALKLASARGELEGDSSRVNN
jgi:hypothetical protein